MPHGVKEPIAENCLNAELKIQSFINPETADYANALFESVMNEYGKPTDTPKGRRIYLSNIKQVIDYINHLPVDFNMKEIDSKYLADIDNDISQKTRESSPFRHISCTYLLLNEKYGWNRSLHEVCEFLQPANFQENFLAFAHVKKFITGEDTISNKILLHGQKLKGGKKVDFIRIIVSDTDDPFTIGLLRNFADTRQHSSLQNYYRIKFFEHFAESLCGNLPDSIDGYDISTFELQEKFFYGIHKYAETECKAFYIYVMQNQHNSAARQKWLAEGIYEYFLLHPKFYDFYSEGYRAVMLLSAEEPPKTDKWVLYSDEAAALTASAKPNEAAFFDFSPLDSPDLKKVVKIWVWRGTTLLRHRAEYAKIVINFFTARQNYMEQNGIEENGIIDTFFVSQHLQCLHDKYSHDHYKHIVAPLKSFFQFQPLYSVDPGVNVFLRAGDFSPFATGRDDNAVVIHDRSIYRGQDDLLPGDPNSLEGRPVPKNDLKAITDVIQSKAQSSNLYFTYYVAYVLNLTTSLRMASILNLTADCLQYREGRPYLAAQTKTSGDDERIYLISDKIANLIKRLVEVTDDIRLAAPQKVKNYLFLTREQQNYVRPLNDHAMARHYRNCCIEAGLANTYTAADFRKTYFKMVEERGMKTGQNFYDLNIYFMDHKTLETTMQHYTHIDIVQSLEMLYGVEIGTEITKSLKPKGLIVDEPVDVTEEDEVFEGCGWCRNSDCQIDKVGTCLMCTGFVTSPEHIGEFEMMIKALDEQMLSLPDNDQHERDHIYQVKRLVASYLVILISLKKKDGEENNG